MAKKKTAKKAKKIRVNKGFLYVLSIPMQPGLMYLPQRCRFAYPKTAMEIIIVSSAHLQKIFIVSVLG
jgi:hypothetical protein